MIHRDSSGPASLSQLCTCNSIWSNSQRLRLWENSYPPMKSRDHSEYLIFAANMGKLETSMHGINPSIQERSFNTSLDQCPWCQNDKLCPASLTKPFLIFTSFLDWTSIAIKIVELTRLDDLSKAEHECHPFHTCQKPFPSFTLSRDLPNLGMNRNVKSTTLVRVCSWVYSNFCGQKYVLLGGLVSQVDKTHLQQQELVFPGDVGWIPTPAFELDPVAPRVSRWSASEEAGSVVMARRNDKQGEGEWFHVHEVLELIITIKPYKTHNKS